MSDTSGTGGFGPAGRGIRQSIRARYSSGASGSQSGQRKKAKASPETPAGHVQALVWKGLALGGKLEEVLLAPELLYYLEKMALFIDKAKAAGLDAVVKELGLRTESTFLSLRRLISTHAPGNSESSAQGSEQHARAGGAFATGSARWASQMSGKSDPTQITVQDLVTGIRSGDGYNEALLLSARLILQEYGERVIQAFLREDETWATKAQRQLIAQFHQQLDAFFEKHSASTDWTTRRIKKTLESYPAFLNDSGQ